MTRDLCVVRDCTPNTALDGLYICHHHHHTAIRQLTQLPHLDNDLQNAYARRNTTINTYTTGTPGNLGINLDLHIFEARDYLRSALTNLTAYICTERGTHPPQLTVLSLTAHLIRNAEWLSADQYAAPNWTTQINNIHKEARSNAYRTRQTSIKLGTCPGTKTDGTPCATTIRHDPSDYAGQNITCRGCGTTNTVDGWQTTLWAGAITHLDADGIAALLTTRYNRVIPPSTIRTWATRQIITTHTDTGRTLYDLTEVRAHADTIWHPQTHTAS